MAQRRLLRVFGSVVREERLQKRLSQEELGFESGLHRNYVSGIERGVRNPSLLAVEALAKALGLSISELMAKTE